MEKRIITFINCTLFIIAWLSEIYSVNYIIREGVLLVLLAIETGLSLVETKGKISMGTFLFLFIAILVVLIGHTSNVSDTFITIRAVLVYPALVFVGIRIAKHGIPMKGMVKLYIVATIIIALFGTIEIIMPSLFQSLIGTLRITYDDIVLIRGGLGTGVGSLFNSRQICGIFLCLGIVLVFNADEIGIEIRTKVQWALVLWFIAIIAMTLSRTSIITAVVVIAYQYFRSVNTRTFLYSIFTIFVFFLLSQQIPFIQNAIQAMTVSLGKMDVTMSGRTDMWSSYLNGVIGFFPNCIALARTSNATYIGAADSSYIRFMTAFGIPLFLISVLYLINRAVFVIRQHASKLFVSLLLFWCVGSIAMDLTFIFMVCVPTYMLLGYEYGKVVAINE